MNLHNIIRINHFKMNILMNEINHINKMKFQNMKKLKEMIKLR